MRRTALLLLTTTLLGACNEPATTTIAAASASEAALTASQASEAKAAAENKDLATLRASTARFHRYDAVAKKAGYTFLFMNMCMVDESADKAGGMGYHYVNTQLLDGTVNVATPEALLYEPEANGQLRLVAVEYVIPKSEWHHDYPPRLFGQDFVLNSFDLWALHVWVWENNPSGLYASWNPRVTCDNAQ